MSSRLADRIDQAAVPVRIQRDDLTRQRVGSVDLRGASVGRSPTTQQGGGR